MHLSLLALATAAWLAGWLLDVGSTIRGIRRSGTVAWERNPIARVVLRRLGLTLGFGALALLESSIVAMHWVVVEFTPIWPNVTAWSAAASLVLAGVAHALAARANITGRLPRVLAPVLDFYEWLGRRMRV